MLNFMENTLFYQRNARFSMEKKGSFFVEYKFDR